MFNVVGIGNEEWATNGSLGIFSVETTSLAISAIDDGKKSHFKIL